MEILKYNKQTVNVPTSWDDITLGVWETFSVVKPATTREKVEQVAIACGVSAELLLSWPEGVFTRILALVDFLYTDNPAAPCAATDFGYVVAMEDVLSLGEYIDVDEAQKKGEAVLSNVLAIVCRPAGEAYDPKNSPQRQKMFAALPVSKVLGVMAFFLQCRNLLKRHTQTCNDLLQLLNLLPQNIARSLVVGGSIKWWRIYPIIRYWILTRLLRARLSKYLRFYNIDATKM